MVQQHRSDNGGKPRIIRFGKSDLPVEKGFEEELVGGSPRVFLDDLFSGDLSKGFNGFLAGVENCSMTMRGLASSKLPTQKLRGGIEPVLSCALEIAEHTPPILDLQSQSVTPVRLLISHFSSVVPGSGVNKLESNVDTLGLVGKVNEIQSVDPSEYVRFSAKLSQTNLLTDVELSKMVEAETFRVEGSMIRDIKRFGKFMLSCGFNLSENEELMLSEENLISRSRTVVDRARKLVSRG